MSWLLWAALCACNLSSQTPPAAAVASAEQVRPQAAEPDPATPATPAMPATPEAEEPSARLSEGEWTLERREPEGFVVRYRGTQVSDSKFLFWGAIDAQGRWGFAGNQAEAMDKQGDAERFMVVSPGLATRVVSEIRPGEQGQLVVDLELKVERPLKQVVGGGIEFDFDFPDGLITPAPPGRTTILEGNLGFEVALGGGQTFQVKFDKPVAKVYLERGDSNRVRTFFIDGASPAGTFHNRMTLTLPQGGRIERSMSERFGRVDATFKRGTVDYRAAPVDLSFLNAGDKPAGQHGRVTVRGDALAFEDGTPARFWGTNLMAYSLFSASPADVKSQAKRMAALGYNLARIHHHDSYWVTPNAIAPGSVSSAVNDQSLAALDYWIKCLHDEGIYVWLDVAVQHVFREGDKIPGFDEIRRNGERIKGYTFLNERAAAVVQAFGDAYLSHRNVHTGVRYMDDPAVVGVLVTNENDLVTHGAYAFVQPQDNPYHHKLLLEQAQAFSKQHGVAAERLMRPWEPGPSPKFFAALEKAHFDAAFSHLRALGVKAPLVGTNFWGNGPFDALPSLSSGDLVDVHTYGGDGQLSRDPRVSENFLSPIVGASLDGMPVTVTEWNTEFPTRDRATTSTYVAALAALQGWDALMLYGYTQNGFPPSNRPEPWNTFNDPALMSTAPNAALMFRRGDVSAAKNHYRLVLSESDVYGARRTPGQSRALRTLMEQSRVTVTLPKVKELDVALRKPQPGAIVVRDMDKDFLPKGHSFVQSDTGELKRDFSAGVFTVDTPRTQVVSGWIGGRPQQLSRLGAEVSTPNAVVALSALDEAPISSSRRLLLSVGAQAVPDPRAMAPYVAQPVVGKVTVKTIHPQMTLVMLSPQGVEGRLVPSSTSPRGGEFQHEFTLPPDAPSHWFLLRPRAAAAKP